VESCKLRYFNSFEFLDHTGSNPTACTRPVALSVPGIRHLSSCSQLPVCCLPKIRLVWVVKIGLEVAKHRWHRIEPVVGNRRHGLRVAQLRKRLRIEAITVLLVVGLRRCEIGLVGLGFAGQETDMGIVAGFGQAVPNFELVFLATKLAGNPCGQVIRKRQENLRAEGP
jgi:hypothetical protein